MFSSFLRTCTKDFSRRILNCTPQTSQSLKTPLYTPFFRSFHTTTIPYAPKKPVYNVNNTVGTVIEGLQGMSTKTKKIAEKTPKKEQKTQAAIVEGGAVKKSGGGEVADFGAGVEKIVKVPKVTKSTKMDGVEVPGGATDVMTDVTVKVMKPKKVDSIKVGNDLKETVSSTKTKEKATVASPTTVKEVMINPVEDLEQKIGKRVQIEEEVEKIEKIPRWNPDDALPSEVPPKKFPFRAVFVLGVLTMGIILFKEKWGKFLEMKEKWIKKREKMNEKKNDFVEKVCEKKENIENKIGGKKDALLQKKEHIMEKGNEILEKKNKIVDKFAKNPFSKIEEKMSLKIGQINSNLVGKSDTGSSLDLTGQEAEKNGKKSKFGTKMGEMKNKINEKIDKKIEKKIEKKIHEINPQSDAITPEDSNMTGIKSSRFVKTAETAKHASNNTNK